jgi:hypothetical protein
MALANANKSVLYYKQQAIGLTAAAGNYVTLPINSETLDENIDVVQTDDIQSNRETPSLRGGNISPAGTVVHDLSPTRSLALFIAMLCGSTAGSAIAAPSAIAASTPYSRGAFVLAAAGGAIWCCRRGGTTPAVVTGLLTGSTTPGFVVELSGGSQWEYVAANATTIYQHTFTPGAAWGVTTTWEKQILGGSANLLVQFINTFVNGCEISVPQTGPVKVTWNLIPVKSVKLGASGAGTPTLPVEDFYMGYDAYVHLNDTVGAGGITVKEFSASYSNGAQEDLFFIGERYRGDVPEGKKAYSGRISMCFTDTTQYDWFKNETVVPLMLTLQRGGNIIKIEWNEVKFTGRGTPNISGNGAIMQEFDWTAFFQSGASKPWKITAWNQTAPASLPGV